MFLVMKKLMLRIVFSEVCEVLQRLIDAAARQVVSCGMSPTGSRPAST